MRTDRRLTVLVFAIAALAGLARGGTGAVDLVFTADERGGGVFAVSSRVVGAPRGAIVVVGLGFDGQTIPGTLRRVELGPEGVLRVTWPARGRVLPGEYEAVATLDSSRQPRSIAGSFAGRPRTFRAVTYVGEPEADVEEEERAQRALLADAAAVASLAAECAEAAPLTTASDARARSARRALLARVDTGLDDVERRLSAQLPPRVFAPRSADGAETLAATVRICREVLAVAAWHDVDCGMDPPAFLDRTRRPRPFATLAEAAAHAARIHAELVESIRGRVQGPHALEEWLRSATTAVAGLAGGDAALADEERRALRARRLRAQAVARLLALDAATSALAGGGDVLRSIAGELEALGAAPADKRARRARALEARLAGIDARVGQERARRRAEVDDLVRTLVRLREEARTRRAQPDRAEWRQRVEHLRDAIAALPCRSAETFPGARANLELGVRALIALDADGAAPAAVDKLLRQALDGVREALAAS